MGSPIVDFESALPIKADNQTSKSCFTNLERGDCSGQLHQGVVF
jgi:hypothetical protein